MNALSRREFLRVSALASAATIAAACAPSAPTQPTAAPQPTSVPAPTTAPAEQPTKAPVPPTAVPEPTKEVSRYNEAPMLAERVAKGELPPIEERLPVNPHVLPVMEEIGQYGGTIRRGFKGPSDATGPWKCVVEFPVFYTKDLALRPEIAESWESSEDGKSLTLHLREGMKWSDGSPFTSADFQWWWEHDALNKELHPTMSTAWTTGAEHVPMVQTAPDDYTVVYEFQHPNPLFVYRVARSIMFAHGDYLKQWHIDLTDDKDALLAQVEEMGFDNWTDVYANKSNFRYNPEIPQVFPWITVTTVQDELFLMERNPYHWQVDEEGNQLPYCDKLQHRLFETAEVFNMWILNGEIDYQGRHVQLANYVLFKEGEESGGYRVHTAANDATQSLCINQTALDPNLRDFFQRRNVRIAISHAIKREEINELVNDGLSHPRQYSPSSASPQYYEKLTNAYLEYDPDKSNAMLDAEGFAERDSEGYRMWLDGSGAITFSLLCGQDSSSTDEAELIAAYLKDVGIKMTIFAPERSLAEERCRTNQVECRLTKCSRAVLPLVDPNFFLGFAIDKSFGNAWTLWYNDPTDPNAEEPPDDGFAKRMWAIWEAIKIEPDTSKHTPMFYQILDILYEELPLVGTNGEEPAPIIMNKKLHNLDINYHIPYSNPIMHGAFIPMQTYFWEDPENH